MISGLQFLKYLNMFQMKIFFYELKWCNVLFYYVGLGFVIVVIFLVLFMFFIDVKVLGIYVLIKLIKFLFLIIIFCWMMGWLLYYLVQ